MTPPVHDVLLLERKQARDGLVKYEPEGGFHDDDDDDDDDDEKEEHDEEEDDGDDENNMANQIICSGKPVPACSLISRLKSPWVPSSSWMHSSPSSSLKPQQLDTRNPR